MSREMVAWVEVTPLALSSERSWSWVSTSTSSMIRRISACRLDFISPSRLSQFLIDDLIEAVVGEPHQPGDAPGPAHLHGVAAAELEGSPAVH